VSEPPTKIGKILTEIQTEEIRKIAGDVGAGRKLADALRSGLGTANAEALKTISAAARAQREAISSAPPVIRALPPRPNFELEALEELGDITTGVNERLDSLAELSLNQQQVLERMARVLEAEQSQNRSWYRNPLIVAIVAAVIGTLIGVAITALVAAVI
jgi:hypothetical protein